ncbi:MAG: hypothetical protein AB2693_32380, partial [Candidatus Thiodiazotropha sp.]
MKVVSSFFKSRPMFRRISLPRESMVLNDLRINICLRKFEVSVERISVCKASFTSAVRFFVRTIFEAKDVADRSQTSSHDLW